MNPKTLSLLSLFAGASVALPSAKRQLADKDYFGLMTIRSGSDIQYAQLQAALGSIFLDLPSENATCTADSNAATFYLDNGNMYLYTTGDAQQLYTDRSGMGQGKFGYTTGSENLARNGERTEFTLDANNDLTFNGAGFLACPNSIEGSWSMWVNAGVDQPAGNSDCVGVTVRAVEVTDPVACTYTINY